MRGGWILAAGMMVLGLIPVLSLAAASVIASIGGCRLHEGFTEICLIGGRDWGSTLYALGLTGWFFFLTAPIALAGFVLGIVLALVSLVRRTQD